MSGKEELLFAFTPHDRASNKSSIVRALKSLMIRDGGESTIHIVGLSNMYRKNAINDAKSVNLADTKWTKRE